MVIKNNIKIKNFGPIKEANIDISPLTIFVGPNSSGKSYSACLIHSLLNPFSGKFEDIEDSISIDSLKYILNNNNEIFDEYNYKFIDYLNEDPDFSSNPFKLSVDEFDKLFYEGIGKFYLETIESNLKNNFFNNINKLNNIINSSFSVEFNGISLINDNGKLLLDNFFLETIEGSQNDLDNKGDMVLSISRDDEFVSIILNPIYLNLSKLDNRYVPGIIYGIISQAFISNLVENSYYIPASSYTISNHLNSVLSHEINGNVNSSKLDKELMSLLLNNETPDEGFFKDIAIELSKEILGGVLQFNNVDEGIKFIDEENGIEFDFKSLSSSVKELTSFIKYLFDLSNEDDFLIIEEPENHLHPENQRILVKYLVKLINNGLNIILTTHSDYILEQFNNFIRLGKVNEDKLSELGYSNENVLDYEDVKIYNFKKESDYLYVPKEVDVNETGFIDENFSEVTDELYNESVDIIDNMESD